MRTLAAAMLLSLVTMTPVASAQGTNAQDDPVITVQAFVRANELADLERILDTFDDAATVFFPGEQPQRASGKARLREVFGEAFKQRKGPITIRPREVSVQSFGDVAIVTAHLRDLPPLPVQQSTSFARRTFVLRRVASRWLIVHLHASNFAILPETK